MKTKTSLSWAAGLAVLLGAAALLAGPARALDARHGEDMTLEGDFSDVLFAAGRRVTMTLNSTDDVFVAARDISVRGGRFDHLFVAANGITFADYSAHDVIAAGQTLTFSSGEIADDLIAGGEHITLMEDAHVAGNAVLGGKKLNISGPIDGSLRAAGRTIHLNGVVTGDVKLEGDTIEIGPDARIGGNLTHRARRIEISPDARVTGTTEALAPRQRAEKPQIASFARGMSWVVLFGFLAMGAVIALLLPGLMNRASTFLRQRPASSFGLGLLIFIGVPILAIILMVTVLGLPIAFLMLAAFALLGPVSLVGVAYALGMVARERSRKESAPPTAGARVLWTVLGLVVLCLVGMIPVLGFLTWLFVFLFGLGAVAVSVSRALGSEPKPAAV